MSMNSINANVRSFADLNNIASRNGLLPNGRDRIVTGKKLNSSTYSGVIWSNPQILGQNLGQNLGSPLQSFSVVNKSLDQAQRSANFALAAGAEISDLLDLIKEKALPAPIANLSASALLKLFR